MFQTETLGIPVHRTPRRSPVSRRVKLVDTIKRKNAIVLSWAAFSHWIHPLLLSLFLLLPHMSLSSLVRCLDRNYTYLSLLCVHTRVREGAGGERDLHKTIHDVFCSSALAVAYTYVLQGHCTLPPTPLFLSCISLFLFRTHTYTHTHASTSIHTHTRIYRQKQMTSITLLLTQTYTANTKCPLPSFQLKTSFLL